MLSLRRLPDSLPAPVVALRWLARFVLAPVLYLLITATIFTAFLLVNHQELLRRVVVLHLRYALRREVSLRAVTLDLRGRAVLSGLRISDRLGSRTPAYTARAVDIRFDPAHLTAFPRLPASALQQVTVDRPYVVIARDAAGRWNFQDLLKPKKKSADRFRGELLVRHGEVILRDARGFRPGGPYLNVHLVEVNLRLAAATRDYLPFRLAAKTADGSVRTLDASGSLRLTDGRVLCAMRVGTVKLAELRRFLPPHPARHADGRHPPTAACSWPWTPIRRRAV